MAKQKEETSISGMGKFYRILYPRVEPWKPIAELEGKNENRAPILVHDQLEENIKSHSIHKYRRAVNFQIVCLIPVLGPRLLLFRDDGRHKKVW